MYDLFTVVPWHRLLACRWQRRVAKRYYDRLFKEYALADLRKYKEDKIGFRWRTEQEVIAGKGQFVCGNKTCSSRRGRACFASSMPCKLCGYAPVRMWM